MHNYRDIINDSLDQYFKNDFNSVVYEAVKYSVFNTGKRVRPSLLLALLEDMTGDYKKGIYPAMALEMIHTYSLVHDDLPAMDNDDYRRNQLTTHKKFGEDMGILAGDALLTEAFVCLSKADFDSNTIVKSIRILAEGAGLMGMIYGQELDLRGENKTLGLDDLKEIDFYKTGQLLTAPLLMAAVIAKREDCLESLKSVGEKIGLAFQIQDDILDITKNLKKTGEESSDLKNAKSTYATIMDLKEADAYAEDLYKEALSRLDSLQFSTNYCSTLIKSLSGRSL